MLWTLGRVNGEAVSRDGRVVYYTVAWADMNNNTSNRDLHMVSLDGGGTTRLMEDRPGESIFHIGFEGRLYYLKEGQIWRCEAGGSGAIQLTQDPDGILAAKISPDEKRIAYAKEVKVHACTAQDHYKDAGKSTAMIFDDLMYRHWNVWETGVYQHVFVAGWKEGILPGTSIDILDGQPYDCPLKPDGGGEDFSWSMNGDMLAYACKKKSGKDYTLSTNTDIYIYQVAQNNTVNASEGMPGYDLEPQWSPDGKSLAWISQARDGFEADQQDIIVYDLDSKSKVNKTLLLDEHVEHFIWNENGSVIYFISPKEATKQVSSIKINSPDAQIRTLTKGVWDVNSFVGLTENKIVVTRTDMNHAPEVYTIDIASGNMEQLTHVNDGLYAKITLPKVESRWFTTTDGLKMKCWIIYPPGFDPLKKYPALLYCQGGPQSVLSQFYSFRWNFQLMASQGYIVIAPCRRGMPGFGARWNEQISQDWGGQSIRDYLVATDSVARLPFVDAKRMGAVGASYGGYSVFQLAGVHHKRFKTFISHCGIFDVKSFYATTDEMWFANWDIGDSWWGSKVPLGYTVYNPASYIDKWDTPILIYHGAKDYRIPDTQGMEAYQAAQLRGIKSRFIYFTDEGHQVMKPQNSLVWHREFYRWLKETL